MAKAKRSRGRRPDAIPTQDLPTRIQIHPQLQAHPRPPTLLVIPIQALILHARENEVGRDGCPTLKDHPLVPAVQNLRIGAGAEAGGNFPQ